MLTEKQQKCINLMILTNKTQQQIAKEINVSEKTICEWKKTKEFKDGIQNEMQENFSSLAIEAQQGLKKLLKSKNEYIKIQAIKDVLDRAGYKSIEKIEHSGNIDNTTNKLLDSINRQLGGGNDDTK